MRTEKAAIDSVEAPKHDAPMRPRMEIKLSATQVRMELPGPVEHANHRMTLHT